MGGRDHKHEENNQIQFTFFYLKMTTTKVIFPWICFKFNMYISQADIMYIDKYRTSGIKSQYKSMKPSFTRLHYDYIKDTKESF